MISDCEGTGAEASRPSGEAGRESIDGETEVTLFRDGGCCCCAADVFFRFGWCSGSAGRSEFDDDCDESIMFSCSLDVDPFSLSLGASASSSESSRSSVEVLCFGFALGAARGAVGFRTGCEIAELDVSAVFRGAFRGRCGLNGGAFRFDAG